MSDNRIYLNLGCGPVQPKGWINVDGSRRCWLAKYLSFLDSILVKCGALPPTEFSGKIFYQNLNKKFKFEDDSVDGIYGGEILEHFTYDNGLSFLRECYRILRKEGIIRICVPDNYTFSKNYIDFYHRLEKIKPEERKEEDIIKFTKMRFDNIQFSNKFWKPNYCHKWEYDQLSLELQLKKTGFIHVVRKKIHDSELPDIEKVERSDFLILEARK